MRMSLPALYHVLTCLLSVLVPMETSRSTSHNQAHIDNCQLQTSLVHVVRPLMVTHGGRVMTLVCSEDVRLTKCEGTCESHVKPSVTRPQGFITNCRCCRERVTEIHAVNLTHCERNDVEVPGIVHTINVKNIVSCHCHKCE